MAQIAPKLNIGCGRDYRDGWINVDISKAAKADFYLDIRTQRLPAATDTASEVYISGVLEQIGENKALIHIMNECWRVLKPKGIMRIVVPHARYAIAHRDPMDIRKFTPETFEYFKSGTPEYKLYGSVYGFQPWREAVVTENARHILSIVMVK